MNSKTLAKHTGYKTHFFQLLNDLLTLGKKYLMKVIFEQSCCYYTNQKGHTIRNDFDKKCQTDLKKITLTLIISTVSLQACIYQALTHGYR